MAEKLCARCDTPNQGSANFCYKCGWRVFGETTEGESANSSGPTKACPMCSVRNPEAASFCPECGNQLSDSGPQQQGGGYPYIMGEENSNAILLSSTRLIVLSVLSLGIYYYYWGYITWKQLQSETEDVHYPVWHALSLIVPVYGLFRIHKHVRVIRDLAAKSGVETSLSPDLAFVLMALNFVLGFTPLAFGGAATILTVFAAILSLTISTTVIVWAQAPLNRHWAGARSDTLSYAPIAAAEVAIVILGLLLFAVAQLAPAPPAA